MQIEDLTVDSFKSYKENPPEVAMLPSLVLDLVLLVLLLINSFLCAYSFALQRETSHDRNCGGDQLHKYSVYHIL